MRNVRFVWLIGLVLTLLIVAIPVAVMTAGGATASDDPWAAVPERRPPTDHTSLLETAFETGPEVTAACLECHESAAHEVADTVHWTWESEPVWDPDRQQFVTTGKKNTINNFCIGIQSNWTGCTSCHAGYGWEDADFNFDDASNVDCLVCHEQSGTYVKSKSGLPAEGVDLLAAAQSVGTPTRENCGGCHFSGGGGDAVKHGDLDSSLLFPPDDVDVHMGRYDFLCVDCHQTTDHAIAGRSITVSMDDANQVACTDCHNDTVHSDDRLNAHVDAVACQTCHIPQGATREATKMHWDWSTAGQDLPEDPHEYLKIKGSFVYEDNFTPEYRWFSGTADRYLLGDLIDATVPTPLNPPHGDIDDADAKIWPFKIHRALQPYDAVNSYLLQPQTVGEDGFWTTFDWSSALANGSAVVGLDFSGEYDFAPTEMYWPLSHMVVPKEQALQCAHCHGESGRFDWEALGYPGDPIDWGGRDLPTTATR